LPPAAGDRVIDLLEGLPTASGAVPKLEPHLPSFRNGLCIDALYHLPATYAQLARWKGDERFADKAVRVALDCMRVLHCKAGWAQWFDPVRKRNNEAAWTRGMGWAVLGMLDLVRLVDSSAADEVAELAARVLERLAQTQAPDGNWAAVLDHPEADMETSTAAFFVAAALHPASEGLVALPRGVLERAKDACHRALSSDGTFTGASEDVLPSWDIKSYEHSPTGPSPWAQGAAVRAFAALARRGPSAS
jgi:rhamnogalacturonyl hydrolase YesR